jgi:hypothetical protein
MSKYMVSAVPREHVFGIWPKVRMHLKRAAEYTYGRYEPEDILNNILEYGHQLWIVFDEGDEIKGALVTSFNVYPRKKYLDLTFLGGEDGPAWKEPMLRTLQHWAHDTGCDGIESIGRLGWEKIFKEDGVKPLWQKFELPVADSGLEA